MRYKERATTGMLSVTIATVAIAGAGLVMPSAAQSQNAAAGGAPRTAWGQPDLQGVWDFRTITPMERPEALADQEFLSAEDVADLEQGIADRDARLAARPAQRTVPTNSVDRGVDGAPGSYNQFWMDRGIPPMTPAGEQRRAAEREYVRDHPADSWADRSIYERCILGFNSGPPIEPRAYNNHMQVFQTRDHVVIFNEMVHDARIIPLAPRDPLPEHLRQWMGDSRGRWEGDTLVIETSNLDRLNSFTWRQGATQDMQLVERFTRVDDGTLLYEFTVEDPATWTRPWSVEVPMARSSDQVWEFACHEGNYGMDGILAGHRADERAAASESR
ncbi:MAG TPA: hypothetical protein EYQ83_08305 [Acidobacteria bacterium]|nr:hypothetical protein [Acidobacteriota bacterium]